TSEDVLRRILDDWDAKKGWYDQPSITTMALALIFSSDFPRKRAVLKASVEYVTKKFIPVGKKAGKFSDNIVADAFLVFNLCETEFLSSATGAPLVPLVERVVVRLTGEQKDRQYWVSEPPFGGAIGDKIYPTAVVIRAL